MIQQFQYRTILVCIALHLVLTGAGQTRIEVSATADKKAILIGEPIRLILKAEIPETEVISFFPVDSIPHFDVIEYGKIDTTNTNTGTRLTQEIIVTSFDSGRWNIPPFALLDSIVTDSIPVDISFAPFDPNQPYHDIKDILGVDVEKKDPWWWYPVGGTVLLILIGVIYWLSRKKKIVQPPPVVQADPYGEALQQLETLKKNQADVKLYYSLLVSIFREYVAKKKGIHSQQKTTDDLVLQLSSLSMNKEIFDRLAQTLRLSDFVKFAKYIPASEENTFSVQAIEDGMREIEQLK